MKGDKNCDSVVDICVKGEVLLSLQLHSLKMPLKFCPHCLCSILKIAKGQ